MATRGPLPRNEGNGGPERPLEPLPQHLSANTGDLSMSDGAKASQEATRVPDYRNRNLADEFDRIADMPGSCIEKVEGVRGVYRVATSVPGPKVVLFGGIHGNEPCGIRSIELLMQRIALGELPLVKGELVFALGNLDAIYEGERQLEHNLNRIFDPEKLRDLTGPEADRARELMTVLDGADYLLDMHSTSAKSNPFAYIVEGKQQGLDSLKVDYGIIIHREALESCISGSAFDYAAKRGTTAFVIESGQHNDREALDHARDAADNFLRMTGIVGGDLELKPTIIIRTDAVITLEEQPFRYSRDLENLTPVAKGEILGEYPNRSGEARFVRAPADGWIVMPAAPYKVPDLKTGEEITLFASFKKNHELDRHLPRAWEQPAAEA